MSDRVIESNGLAKVTADAVTHFLGFSAAGTPVLVDANSMLIYRGALDSEADIDDPSLPMGIYSLNGTPKGTFPNTSSQGAAFFLNWKAAPITVTRMQMMLYYWNDEEEIHIRRYKGNKWTDWLPTAN